jgi:multidrug efflux pump
MSATAAENYAGVALEFEFGWDKTAIMADARRDERCGGQIDGADKYSLNEINFSEFPIIIVNLDWRRPETMARVADE